MVQREYAEALRALGKSLERTEEMYKDDAKSLIGKCYLASCNRVDVKQADINQDRELVCLFAKTLRDVIENISSQEEISEEAIEFIRTADFVKLPPAYYGPRKSLYILSRESCTEQGYHEIGSKILNASESLRKKLPQDNKQFLQDHAVMILSDYLKNSHLD